MRALVLSDNPPIASQLQEILSRAGHECEVFPSASPGPVLGHLANVRPELLLVILLPDWERALVTLKSVRRSVQAPVLAVGPATDPQLILQALREGADHYVDQATLEKELESLLPRLQTEGEGQAEPGRFLALLAASGGSGSSTLAVNLAAVLAQQYQACALLDLKPGVGDLAALLDLKPTYTLADLCLDITRLDQAMLERSLARHASGVHLLASPRTLADIRHVTPQGIRQALALARIVFPFVVGDLDDCFHEEQIEALRQAHLILLVLRLDFTSLRSARRILEHLSHIGIPREQVRLIVNRYGQPEELPAATAERALGMKISHYVPDEPKTINRANNTGTPAVLETPKARVSKVIAQLAASVNGRHGA
jgi:pilus assembly protein CpaE